MRTTIVQYTTKADKADDNQLLVESVFAELASTEPNGIRYASFRLEDGVTFLHIALIDDPENNPLSASPAFAEFQREIHDRCEIPPAVTGGTLVGSYGLWA
jgi:hypothetical protein